MPHQPHAACGNPDPSPEDVLITRQLVEAGRLLDVELLDSLMIGRGAWVNLCEHGSVPIRITDGWMSLRAKRSNLPAREEIASATLRSLQAIASAPRNDRRRSVIRIGSKP